MALHSTAHTIFLDVANPFGYFFNYAFYISLLITVDTLNNILKTFLYRFIINVSYIIIY